MARQKLMHEYTTEILYHYVCGKCKGWWSYASTDITRTEKNIKWQGTAGKMCCPHCGRHAELKPK